MNKLPIRISLSLIMVAMLTSCAVIPYPGQHNGSNATDH